MKLEKHDKPTYLTLSLTLTSCTTLHTYYFKLCLALLTQHTQTPLNCTASNAFKRHEAQTTQIINTQTKLWSIGEDAFSPVCSNVPDKPECKRCAKALQELENIDDEADQLGIGFVKIHDEELAEEYSLGELPRLVYYRHEIPIIYEGL